MATADGPFSTQYPNVDQLFGSCSSDDIDQLFGNYPEECREAYQEISEVVVSGKHSSLQVGSTYSTVCSESCLKPVSEFRRSCNAERLTEVVSRACERSPNELCALGFFKNNGTMAAELCSGVRITGKCSQECRISLVQLTMDLGCCLHSFLGDGAFGYSVLSALDYQVWSLCQVDLQPKCSESSGGKETATSCSPPFLVFTGLLIASYASKWI